jgi:hypothetical protein
MTWAGKQSEQPRSLQSPEKYLLLTFPFIERACGKLRGYRYSASDRTKKAGILDSGLVDHEMVAGVRFELTTFGLCDLTQLSLRVGLYLHPGERDARHPVSTPSSIFRGLVRYCRTRTAGLGSTDFDE